MYFDFYKQGNSSMTSSFYTKRREQINERIKGENHKRIKSKGNYKLCNGDNHYEIARMIVEEEQNGKERDDCVN